MTTPDGNSATGALVNGAGTPDFKPSALPVPATEPSTSTKLKKQNIRVSSAVLDAARKDGEQLLRDLRTSLSGLAQADAEQLARTTGPNEVAQERKQGWPLRLLKITRNPLVILLTTLSAISFLYRRRARRLRDGDYGRAECGTPFLAGSASRRSSREAEGHDPRNRYGRPGWRREGDSTPRLGARRHRPPGRRRHDSRRRKVAVIQRSLREPGKPHGRVAPGRKVPRPRNEGELPHPLNSRISASWGRASRAGRRPRRGH